MKIHVLLTLDLPKVNAEARQKFYDHLEEKEWDKLDNLTTAWKCSFQEDITKADAIGTCKKDLANAAKHAGISKYSAALQAGQSYQLQSTDYLEQPVWTSVIEFQGSDSWQEVVLPREAASAYLRLIPNSGAVR